MTLAKHIHLSTHLLLTKLPEVDSFNKVPDHLLPCLRHTCNLDNNICTDCIRLNE